MNENEFLIELQAKLDEAKSKENINGNIDAIQKNIKELQLQAKIDQASIDKIVKQVESVLGKEITISNIKIDSSNIEKQTQNTVNDVANTIRKTIKSTIQGIKNEISNTVKSIPRLDANKIIGDMNLNRSSIETGIVSQVKLLVSEINNLGHEVTKVGNDDSWEKLLKKSNDLGEILSKFGKTRDLAAQEDTKKFADYFKGKTLSVGYKSSGLSGTDFNVNQLNKDLKELSVKFSAVKQDAIELNSIWEEMCTVTGRSDLQNITNAQDQIQTVIQELLKAQSILNGEDGLVKHPNGRGIIDEYVNNIEKSRNTVINLEKELTTFRQKESETSSSATNTVVQNEERKQAALEKTANTINQISSPQLSSFRDSLTNMGMSSDEIDAIASKINNLGIQIESLSQVRSIDKDTLSVTISGIDQYGQAIKLTQQYNVENKELLNTIESVASVQQKAGATTNTFAKQQAQSVANLTNQINQLNRAANDQNATRPISDSSHLNSLSTTYNEIISAIQRMSNASKDTFTDEQNNVRTLISNYKSLVSEFRNAENVSSKMKGTDIASGLEIARNDLEKFKADAKDFPSIIKTINDLDSAIVNVGDASSLNAFSDQLRVARSELAKIKSEVSSTNRNEKVGINVSGLTSKITDLQRLSPEINKFEAEINNAKVTIQSLLDDLSKVSTQGDFSVINSKWKAFTDAAKSAGIAITEVVTKSDSLASQINKIQGLSNGTIKNDYSSQIAKLEGNFRNLGFTAEEVKEKTSNVTSAFEALRTRVNQPFDESNYQEIISLNDTLQRELAESNNEYTRLSASTKGYVTVQQRLSKANVIEAWNQKNSGASQDALRANETYINSLRDLNSQMSKMQFNEITDGFKRTENSMRGIGKLGTSVKEQFAQATKSFTQLFSIGSIVATNVI